MGRVRMGEGYRRYKDPTTNSQDKGREYGGIFKYE